MAWYFKHINGHRTDVVLLLLNQFIKRNQPCSARQSGVDLAVDKRTSSALLSWQPVSERLLIAKFSHTFGILAVFVAYAPTNASPDSDKDSFYAELDYHIQNLKPSDVVLGLGDFNAETGTTRVNLERVLGPHGSGTRNDNSERLLNFCSDKGLHVAGSWFQRCNIHRLVLKRWHHD